MSFIFPAGRAFRLGFLDCSAFGGSNAGSAWPAAPVPLRLERVVVAGRGSASCVFRYFG